MDSVAKNMSDLVKIKDEDKITPYVKDSESGEEADVAKEQLDVLVKIQNDLKRQQVVQQATLTSQFLLVKMQETMSKLLTERSNDFERQRKSMMSYMQRNRACIRTLWIRLSLWWIKLVLHLTNLHQVLPLSLLQSKT